MICVKFHFKEEIQLEIKYECCDVIRRIYLEIDSFKIMLDIIHEPARNKILSLFGLQILHGLWARRRSRIDDTASYFRNANLPVKQLSRFYHFQKNLHRPYMFLNFKNILFTSENPSIWKIVTIFYTLSMNLTCIYLCMYLN